jgi:membrane protein
VDVGQPQRYVGHPWKPSVELLRTIARNVWRHDISATATQLAFHFTFCFFPMLLVLGVVLAWIDAPFLFQRIMVALHIVMPPSAVGLVDQVLLEVRLGSNWKIFIAGLTLALWSAVSGLELLINAINHAYGVHDDRPYWVRVGLALGLTLLLAVLLVGATALVLGGRWLGLRIATWMGRDSWSLILWVWLRWPTVVVSVMTGLLVLYTAAPKLPISAKRAFPGAVVAGSAWVVTTLIFGWYINTYASYNRVYGSIGGMIILMLWLYVGGIVILLGAEINGALYQRRRAHERSP